MRTVFFYVSALVSALALPGVHSYAQPAWEYENGPYGGTFIAIIDHGAGLAAAPYYRPFVLMGNAEGTQWRQADLPDAAAQPFSLWSAGTRLLAGGFGTVYRSDDDGVSWRKTEIPDLLSGAITRICGSGDTLFGQGGGWMIRSFDRGVTWHALRGNCLDVATTDARYVAFAGDSTLLESRDSGASWFAREGSPVGIRKLHVVDGVVYAARGDSSLRPTGPALFRLDDPYSGTWRPCGLREPLLTAMTMHDGILYGGSNARMGGPHVLRSIDGGWQWEEVHETRKPFPRPAGVSALHGTRNALLAGVTNLGIWRLEDNAESWRHATDGFFPVGVARVGFDGGRITAYSMKENLTAYRDGRGDPWELLPYEQETHPGDMLVRDGQVTLGTASGTRGTTDYGVTWVHGVLGDGSRRVQALGSAGVRMIAGAETGVAAWSGDAGKHWSAGMAAGVQTWYTFAEGPTGDLYAATAPSGVLISTDAGENWTPAAVQFMDQTTFDVAASGGIVYGASNRGIAAWSSAGASSTLIYDRPAYRLCATPRGLVAATQDDGIIFFPGFGERWGTLNQGLPEAHFATPDVCRIALAYDGGRLYFGNCGMPGLWSIDLLAATAAAAPASPDDPRIVAVYPQPISGPGWIALRLQQGAHVRLTVRDLLGRRLRLLHDGIIHRSSVTLSVGAGMLPVGISVLELETDTVRDVRFIAVVR